jgi:hypothetical protein
LVVLPKPGNGQHKERGDVYLVTERGGPQLH